MQSEEYRVRREVASGKVPSHVSIAPPTPREWFLIRAGLWIALALGIATVLLTYRDYGATWDEAIQAEYGELAVRYFATAGKDQSCNSFGDLRHYGPLIEMIPALVYSSTEAGKYEVRHLVLGLLATLTIPATWLYGRLFGDPRVALFSVIAVTSVPRFYGHWFNNSKDIPFAVLVLCFMLTLAAAFTEPTIRWRKMLACGLAMGLALCARPGGFPLFALYLCAAAGTWLVTRERSERGEPVSVAVWRLVPKVSLVVGLAWAVMVLPWPWAHGNAVLHPIESMRYAVKFPTIIQVLFDGATIPSNELPRSYIWKYVLIGTPLTVLALALAGLLLGLRDQLADWRSRQSRMVTLTQVWFFAPMLLYMLVKPNVYGGMRHFLFVLPPLGILAAFGAAGLLRMVRNRRWRRAAWIALLAVLLMPVTDLVRLHPYQMTYYNALVGGTAGASERYWTDYSLSSYKEAIGWVNDRAADADRRILVLIGANPAVMLWSESYASPNVELLPLRSVGRRSELLSRADYYIATTRGGLDQYFPDRPVVHTIGRDGAVFTVIKGRESALRRAK